MSNGVSDDAGLTLRMRFLNFNMANNSRCCGGGVASLPSPCSSESGLFEDGLHEPFADGGMVDLVFTTLAETRLPVTSWLQEYVSQPRGSLDHAICQNSRKESEKKNETVLFDLMEGVAEKYNGNLKTILLYSSKRFRHDASCAVLFGRLTETKIANFAIPNPKKAFLGQCLLPSASDVRFCFVGAHFPVSELADALEDTRGNALETAKIILARTLRKVLRRAKQKGILDDRTVIVLQGDLNSRTVRQPGEPGATDVLFELLRDRELQAAIQHGLCLPHGRWHEPAHSGEACDLPVTYKFTHDIGGCFQTLGPGQKKSTLTLRLGDVLAAADVEFGTTAEANTEPYKAILQNLPPGILNVWGLDFNENKFRPFRFPAAADRLLCWTPHTLAQRLTWSWPHEGYEVNQRQGDSDHRAVTLEAMLHIAPPLKEDARTAPETNLAEPSYELLQAVSRVDAEDSDGIDASGCDAPGSSFFSGSALPRLRAAVRRLRGYANPSRE